MQNRMRNPATPNHALQRTGAAVTAPCFLPPPFPAAQGTRQPRPSLSLGSFGRKIPSYHRSLIIAMRMLTQTMFFLSLCATASAQVVNDQILQEIKVTSGRTYAMMQFNRPAVQVWLPRLINSAYATQTFSKPKLVDIKGQAVEYEFERGLYDHDK